MHPLPPFRARQGGAALIMGLVFLVVLTVIGITAARMSSLEERMSGNMRDRSLAMQAAELALRDAERDILQLGNAANLRVPAISGVTDFAVNCNQDNTTGTADDGLCYNGPGGFPAPLWTCTVLAGSPPTVTCPANSTQPNILTMAPSVAYGTFTGAAAIPLVNLLPRYIIEGFHKRVSGSDAYFYRITVRAVGANPNTVVWLQEVFKQ
jgi:type IV pilus assembly protein PilX